jgi:hypothetical protein
MNKTKKTYTQPVVLTRGTLATLTRGGILPGRKSHKRKGRHGPQYDGS